LEARIDRSAVNIGDRTGPTGQMRGSQPGRSPVDPVVHLELQTANPARACAFYTRLFGWRAETIRVGSSAYLGLELAEVLQGGVVEREDAEAAWLPYVEVADVAGATARGRALGAAVVLEPREGPAGWRSILAVPAGAQIALWQPKV
jgi:predicted enzyme related to lactoylglutathione lyase